MNTGQLKRVHLIFEECDIYELLKAACSEKGTYILDELKKSGLRGRGGAGFPTASKWQSAQEQNEEIKYVICNADEGEPGTFKDREILTKVPFKVFAGMALCAYVINARKAYIYLRGEYRYLKKQLESQICEFNKRVAIYLDFSISLKMGSGAYICGEETALLESMEGKRGEPRNKPPFPTQNGYMQKPTVINNVETFVYTVMIFKYGGNQFKKLGSAESSGSKVFSVSGDCSKPGIYELEMGMLLQDFVTEFGDGDTKAVQIGGASGQCVPRKMFKSTIIGFEGIPTGGSMMLFNSSRSMYNTLVNFLEFFSEESCGQCTPCRIGSQQLLEGIKAIKKQEMPQEYLYELIELSYCMEMSSKCGLGQSIKNPFCSIAKYFREEILY